MLFLFFPAYVEDVKRFSGLALKVKAPTWIGDNEEEEFVGVGARFGPTLESKEKDANKSRVALTDPPDCCSTPKNKNPAFGGLIVCSLPVKLSWCTEETAVLLPRRMLLKLQALQQSLLLTIKQNSLRWCVKQMKLMCKFASPQSCFPEMLVQAWKRVGTVLLSCAFLFWVFVSKWWFHESVMIMRCTPPQRAVGGVQGD
ncbi:hypothetical protein L1987_23311 [Smallanthus sonchifolius]|uniref:Uncharacterized protein n=1 Tax=Smallanthus sonchifolius TaxID=185202 RepID=A0ACB9IGL0_9ASTR|nr:hypothetical protein L1987_23311 [Smallanthus sonchifolius]